MRKYLAIAALSFVTLVILLSISAITEFRWSNLGQVQSALPTSTLEQVVSTPVTSVAQTTPISETEIIVGRVISLDGKPIQGANVYYLEQKTTTDINGHFEFRSGEGVQWVTAEHPDFLSRTRAASINSALVIRLTPDDGETVAIHFVGDTMFGRRYFDPNEDGNPNDGLLGIDATPQEHLELLRYVQPLLENADITAINLESSLSPYPYIDPTEPRPANYHPTKEYIFATHINAASAFKQSGVDVIDLANNHLYDALDQGVEDTFDGLEQAGYQGGIGYFGAGLSENQAWEPAVIDVRGQTIAFLGCTSITYPFIKGTPDRNAISYFASETFGKGGAARCEEDAIRAAVGEAANNYDTVVMMIHGGSEYERAPTDVVVRMTDAAREAGATLVVNHQPHVVGGFDWNDSSFVAWTLGNFAFDQTLWETLETYLLAVHIRKGKVIRAYVEPLIIEGYLPKGVTGELAEFVARGAAGREPGPFIIESGSMEVDLYGIGEKSELIVPLNGKQDTGTVFRLKDGWGISNISGQNNIMMGRDMLWVGSFENEDTDPSIYDDTLWELDGPNKYFGLEYAFSGKMGVRLQRGALDREDVVLTTVYRIPVETGSEISILGMVRASENAIMDLQLSWYPESRGPSSIQTVEPIEINSANTWQAFRFDTTIPADTIATKLFIRLNPPLNGLATADFDNIKIIKWAPEGTRVSPLYDHIKVVGNGEITIRKDILPSGIIGNILSSLTPIE